MGRRERKARRRQKGKVYTGKLIKTRRSFTDWDRTTIFYRDGWRCLRCGKKSHLTVDHIIPVSRGGSSHPENLQTLCKKCNEWKGSKPMSFRDSEHAPTW